jgi:hypothetical protein
MPRRKSSKNPQDRPAVRARIEIAKDFTEPFARLWEGRAMHDDRLDEHFSLGLRNIRRAIEARLEASGMQRQSLGDTSNGSKRAAPGMVIIDVGANNKIARVTFTRDEVEDCTRAVDAYCVRSKIDHVVEELLR